MSEVCHDVCVEPALQPLTGEHLSLARANRKDSARLDMKMVDIGYGQTRRQICEAVKRILTYTKRPNLFTEN